MKKRWIVAPSWVCLACLMLSSCAPAVLPSSNLTITLLLPPAAPPSLAQSLQQVLDESLKPSGAPGIVAQVITPSWSWSGAAGLADNDPALPVQIGMHFRIASITKTFLAAAILTLVQQGKLELDEPAANWLPSEWTAQMTYRDQITIRHLLQHTSGLASFPVYDWMIETRIHPQETIPIERAVQVALDGSSVAPGTKWEYNNAGFVLLSFILERASGMPYATYMQQAIFQPLGLTNTMIPTGPTIPEPYMRCLAGAVDYTIGDMGWARGAGELISTAEDLDTFHRALRSGRMLDPEIQADMLNFLDTPGGQMRFVKPDGSAGYGFGYERQQKTSQGITLEGHSGGVPGSLSFMFYWVEGDTFISYNVNTTDPAAQNIVLRLVDAVKHTLLP
jgi:D-alanyl-D-alanine carboxypeptidase